MSNKKKLITISGVFIFLLIFVIFYFINNNEKEITCKSLYDNITIEFKNNKAYYIEGSKDLPYNISDKNLDNVKQNINMYNDIMKIENKKIYYSFSYNKENENALSFLGLDIKDSSYKEILNYFENNNYTCK